MQDDKSDALQTFGQGVVDGFFGKEQSVPSGAPQSPLVEGFINEIINPAIAVLFAVGFAIFLWGIVRFIWKADDENERNLGKQNILWGVVGMFIMASVFAIIRFIARAIGVTF